MIYIDLFNFCNSNLLPAGTRMTCGRSCLPGRMFGFWLIIWTLCLKAHSCFTSWLSSKTAAMGMVPCRGSIQ